ncbi:hypothetical protein N2152v2_009568 [Parachlorella kessleri]
MGKHDMPTGGRPQHKPRKLGAGISIEKFAKAKSSGYDKRAIQEKERALNAKKVNKYKKLKQRLQDKLQPPPRLAAVLRGGEGEESELEEQQKLSHPPKIPRDAAPAVSPAAAEPATAGAVPGSPPAAGTAAAHRREPDGGIQPALQDDRLAERQHKQRQQGKGAQRQKPTSQLQRLAADVQVKKEAEQREREERDRQAAERRAKLEEDRKRRATQNKMFRKKTHSGQPLMKYRLEKVLGKLGAAGAS